MAVADTPATIPPVIGLIAGEGDFPILLSQGAVGAGVQVVVFGVHGLASERLDEYAEARYSLKLTDFTRLFDLCRQHGVKHVVMAGRVPHKVLLQQITLDPRMMKVLAKLRNKKADSLLRAATMEIEKEGIEVLDSTLFLKSVMPKPGVLTPSCPPSDEVLKDMHFGYPIAKEIARLDVGQTIAVKNQIVVAVEGVEGTDELIKRAGALAGPGIVIVKVSKPKQDMRFDVPVIGIKTFQNMADVKASGLIVTAGQTIFLDKEDAIHLAERHSIAVLSYKETGTETPYIDALM
jgi:DUF1009 family protein